MYELSKNIPNSKLAKLVIDYPDLMSALEHFGIPLGLGDKTVVEIAKEYAIDSETFEVVVMIYCKEIPSKIITKNAIPDLLRFLEASHNNFKNEKIPELKELIELFSEEISPKQGKVLIAFFNEYIKEINEHFLYEDSKVFPYVNNILGGRNIKGFRIRDFEKNHTDIEQKLLDLKNILVKYIPTSVVSKYRKLILSKLIVLEQDLNYHTQIEDNIIVPFVKNMESQNHV